MVKKHVTYNFTFLALLSVSFSRVKYTPVLGQQISRALKEVPCRAEAPYPRTTAPYFPHSSPGKPPLTRLSWSGSCLLVSFFSNPPQNLLYRHIQSFSIPHSGLNFRTFTPVFPIGWDNLPTKPPHNPPLRYHLGGFTSNSTFRYRLTRLS